MRLCIPKPLKGRLREAMFKKKKAMQFLKLVHFTIQLVFVRSRLKQLLLRKSKCLLKRNCLCPPKPLKRRCSYPFVPKNKQMGCFGLTLGGHSLCQKQPCIYHYGVITSFFCSTVNTKVFHGKIGKLNVNVDHWWQDGWVQWVSFDFIVAVHNSVPQSTGIPSFYLIWPDGRE